MSRLRSKTKVPKVRTLALQIKELRQSLRLSQGQFARTLGVSQQTVSDWERGKRLRQIEVVMRLIALLR